MNAVLDKTLYPSILPWLLLASAAGALGTAYTAELAFGYEPCVLCLYQRIPYALVALLGIAAVFLASPAQRALIAYGAAMVFAVSAGLAFYHVGVEQHWWTSVAPCGADGPVTATSTEDLMASLMEKPPKACDEVDWTFLGISMATYNVAFSALLALTSFAMARRLIKGAV